MSTCSVKLKRSSSTNTCFFNPLFYNSSSTSRPATTPFHLVLFIVSLCLQSSNVICFKNTLLPGIFKTFQEHACSGSQLTLDCPGDTIIAITFATYGLVPLASSISTSPSALSTLPSSTSSPSSSSSSALAASFTGKVTPNISGGVKATSIDPLVPVDNALCLLSPAASTAAGTSASDNSKSHQSYTLPSNSFISNASHQQSTSSHTFTSSSSSPPLSLESTVKVDSAKYEACLNATESFRYDFLRKVESTCREKSSCAISTTPESIGLVDPCPSIPKLAEVAFKCRPYTFSNKISCEGKSLTMRCPDDGQAIAIYSAFFGSKSTPVAECPPRGFALTPANRLPSLSDTDPLSPLSLSADGSVFRSKRQDENDDDEMTRKDDANEGKTLLKLFSPVNQRPKDNAQESMVHQNKQMTQSHEAKVLEYQSPAPHDSFIDTKRFHPSPSNLQHSSTTMRPSAFFDTQVSTDTTVTEQLVGSTKRQSITVENIFSSAKNRSARSVLSPGHTSQLLKEERSSDDDVREANLALSQALKMNGNPAEAAFTVTPIASQLKASPNLSGDWTCQTSNATEVMINACVGKKECNFTVNEKSLGSPACKSSENHGATALGKSSNHVYHLKVAFACVPSIVLKTSVGDFKRPSSSASPVDHNGYVAHAPPKNSPVDESRRLINVTRGGIEGLRDILASTTSSNISSHRPYPTPFSTLRDVLKNQSSTLNYGRVTSTSGPRVTTTFPPYHSSFDQSITRGGKIDEESASLAATSDGSSGIKLSSVPNSKDTASATDDKNKSPISRKMLSLVNFVKVHARSLIIFAIGVVIVSIVSIILAVVIIKSMKKRSTENTSPSRMYSTTAPACIKKSMSNRYFPNASKDSDDDSHSMATSTLMSSPSKKKSKQCSETLDRKSDTLAKLTSPDAFDEANEAQLIANLANSALIHSPTLMTEYGHEDNYSFLPSHVPPATMVAEILKEQSVVCSRGAGECSHPHHPHHLHHSCHFDLESNSGSNCDERSSTGLILRVNVDTGKDVLFAPTCHGAGDDGMIIGEDALTSSIAQLTSSCSNNSSNCSTAITSCTSTSSTASSLIGANGMNGGSDCDHSSTIVATYHVNAPGTNLHVPGNRHHHHPHGLNNLYQHQNNRSTGGHHHHHTQQGQEQEHHHLVKQQQQQQHPSTSAANDHTCRELTSSQLPFASSNHVSNVNSAASQITNQPHHAKSFAIVGLVDHNHHPHSHVHNASANYFTHSHSHVHPHGSIVTTSLPTSASGHLITPGHAVSDIDGSVTSHCNSLGQFNSVSGNKSTMVVKSASGQSMSTSESASSSLNNSVPVTGLPAPVGYGRVNQLPGSSCHTLAYNHHAHHHQQEVPSQHPRQSNVTGVAHHHQSQIAFIQTVSPFQSQLDVPIGQTTISHADNLLPPPPAVTSQASLSKGSSGTSSSHTNSSNNNNRLSQQVMPILRSSFPSLPSLTSLDSQGNTVPPVSPTKQHQFDKDGGQCHSHTSTSNTSHPTSSINMTTVLPPNLRFNTIGHRYNNNNTHHHETNHPNNRSSRVANAGDHNGNNNRASFVVLNQQKPSSNGSFFSHQPNH